MDARATDGRLPADAASAPIPRRPFYFLRHGQTNWNLERRFQGHTDIPLNELGLAQAQDAARMLAICPIDLIVASPLVRALKTAAVVAEAIGKPLRIDSDLKERHFGEYEGLIILDVKRKLGIAPNVRTPMPASAEQWSATGARCVRVLGRWLDAYPSSTILFVSHSGLFDALHELAFGVRIEPKHVPYRWKPQTDGWSCEALA